MPSETPQTTSTNLKKVSLILFIVLGLVHLLSGFLMTSSIGLPSTFIVNHILDIPFAITALIYGLSSISVGLKAGDHKMFNTIAIAITLLIFLGLIYINLFIPSKITA